MIRSASGPSRWAMGSSRIRNRGVASNARASASRRRCPPETSSPCWPTIVSRPSGSEWTKPSSSTVRSAFHRSSSVASRPAINRFSRTVVLNRCASCPQMRTAARRSSPGRPRGCRCRRASPVHSSGRGTARAARARVVLPTPLGPTSATRSPGLDPQIGTVEHDRLVGAVAHDHALERERAVTAQRSRLRADRRCPARSRRSPPGAPRRTGRPAVGARRRAAERRRRRRRGTEARPRRGARSASAPEWTARDADDEHREQAGAGEQTVQAARARRRRAHRAG